MELNFKRGWWILALLLFSVGILSIVLRGPLTTYDYWWHLKAGEWMLDHHTLPFIDVFSWFGVENELYWMSHEWLSEVVLAGFHRLLSQLIPTNTAAFSGYLFTCLSLFGLFSLLCLTNLKTYVQNVFVTSSWLFLGVLIFVSVASPRPHLLSYFLLVLTLWSLERFRRQGCAKALVGIPIYSFLWVNFHGGSSNLPYLLCLLYLIGGLVTFEWRGLTAQKWTPRQRKELLLTALLSFIVLVLNPHGLAMITYPYENMQDHYMRSVIGEWFPPLLRLDGHVVILAQVLILVLILLFKKRSLQLIDFLLLGGFTYLAIGSLRFSPILYLVSSFILLPYIEGMISLPTASNLKVSHPLYSLVMGSLGMLLVGLWMFQLPDRQESALNPVLSEELVAIIQAENPQRLYNYYDLGSELIYHDIPVFVDGRADLYSKNILKDAVDLGFLKQDPVALFEKYQFDYLLTYQTSPLGYYLETFSQATLVAEDNGVVFYRLNQN